MPIDIRITSNILTIKRITRLQIFNAERNAEMRTAFKAFIVIILSLVMFVACAGQEPEVFDVDFSMEYATDLGGITFKWGSAWPQELDQTEGFSIMGDKMRARYREVEAELNCKIEIVPWSDGVGSLPAEVASGFSTLDLLDGHVYAAGLPLYKAGILLPVDSVPNMSGYDEKYGPIRFRQNGVFDGVLYGIYQYMWDFPPQFACSMVFNRDMLLSFGDSLPYEYQENGSWNWNNYRELLYAVEDAAKNSGNEGSFIPMLSLDLAKDALGFMFVNGCQVISKNSNGGYYWGLDNQAGIEALEYLNGLYSDKLYRGGSADVFTSSKAAFMVGESYYSTNYNESNSYLPGSNIVYGFINYPYGPHGDENCVSSYVHRVRRLNWIIGFSGNSIDDIGMIIDRLFEPIDDTEGWKGSLERNIFFDSRDFDNYKFMVENINYRHDADLGEKASSLMDDAFTKAISGSRSPGEAFDSIRTAVNEAIAENVNWVYEDLVN